MSLLAYETVFWLRTHMRDWLQPFLPATPLNYFSSSCTMSKVQSCELLVQAVAKLVHDLEFRLQVLQTAKQDFQAMKALVEEINGQQFSTTRSKTVAEARNEAVKREAACEPAQPPGLNAVDSDCPRSKKSKTVPKAPKVEVNVELEELSEGMCCFARRR